MKRSLLSEPPFLQQLFQLAFMCKGPSRRKRLSPQNMHRADEEESMESSDSDSDLDSEEQHSSAPNEDPEPPILPPVGCARRECRAGQIPLKMQLRCKYCDALTRRCYAGCSIPHCPFAVCSTNIS
jgi:hypothetical protein